MGLQKGCVRGLSLFYVGPPVDSRATRDLTKGCIMLVVGKLHVLMGSMNHSLLQHPGHAQAV